MHTIEPTLFDHPDGSRTVFSTLNGERVLTVASRTKPPVANVLLIHGLGDYPARHIQNARRLATLGCRTVMVELAGHGGPADLRSTRPIYEAYATADQSADVLRWLQSHEAPSAVERREMIAEQYARLEETSVGDHLRQIATVLQHLDHLLADSQRLPLFLVGHSMGALLAHETAWRMASYDRAALAGVALIAPALRPQGNPDSPIMQLVVNGIWALRRAPLSPTRTAFKAVLDANFGVDTTWGNKWLSDVPVEVELFATDPLLPHRLPTRYASSIESLMVESAHRSAKVPYDGLVMVPRRDGITSREAAVSFARQANGAGGGSVSLVHFDVVAHDILRSSSRDRALATLGAWLEGRLQQRRQQFAEYRYAS